MISKHKFMKTLFFRKPTFPLGVIVYSQSLLKSLLLEYCDKIFKKCEHFTVFLMFMIPLSYSLLIFIYWAQCNSSFSFVASEKYHTFHLAPCLQIHNQKMRSFFGWKKFFCGGGYHECRNGYYTQMILLRLLNQLNYSLGFILYVLNRLRSW